MGELLRFELDEGGSVVAQMDHLDGGVVDATSASDVVARATGSFESALEGVHRAAAATLRRMSALPQRPDEVTVEFGVQLDAEVGAVLARTGAQGHLQIQITWRRTPPDGRGTGQGADQPGPGGAAG